MKNLKKIKIIILLGNKFGKKLFEPANFQH